MGGYMIRNMVRALGLGALLSGLTPLSAQQGPVAIADEAAKAHAPFWTFANNRLHHVASGLSFPVEVGSFRLIQLASASHPKSGLDDVLQYKVPQQDAFISLFIFRPTLADTGLISAMTDRLIRDRFGADVKPETVDRAIGGKTGAMRTVGYAGASYNGSPAWTAASFVRVGPWLAVMRVTGPAAQRALLEKTVADLAGEIGVVSNVPTRAFHRIEATGCKAADGKKAAQVPIDPKAAMAYAILIASTDSGVEDGDGKALDGTRVPDRFCSSIIGKVAGQRRLLLRTQGVTAGGLPLTDMAGVLLMDDAGSLLEISRPAMQPTAPYFVIRHGVGEASIMAALDRAPTSDQYEAMIEGKLLKPDKGQVGYKIDAYGKINVLVPPGMEDAVKQAQ